MNKCSTNTMSRNKLKLNKSSNMLNSIEKTPNVAQAKLSNWNSSDNLIQQSLTQRNTYEHIPRNVKVSKEAQLITWIRNISPYLSNKITKADIRNHRHIKNEDFSKRSEHNTSKIGSHKKTSNSRMNIIKRTTDRSGIKGKKLKVGEISKLDILPPISTEVESEDLRPFEKDNNREKSDSTFPQFRSPFRNQKSVSPLRSENLRNNNERRWKSK